MPDEIQKQQDIRQLQMFLRTIAYNNEKIPQVVPDGIYGPETAAAVRAFQEDFGLPVTGEVDYATWNALLAEYYAALLPITNPFAIEPFPSPSFVLKKSDSGNLVFITQVLLNQVAESLSDIIKLPVNGQFDSDMEEAVKNFQKFSMLPVTGKIDRATWDKLAQTYNSQVSPY